MALVYISPAGIEDRGTRTMHGPRIRGSLVPVWLTGDSREFQRDPVSSCALASGGGRRHLRVGDPPSPTGARCSVAAAGGGLGRRAVARAFITGHSAHPAPASSPLPARPAGGAPPMASSAVPGGGERLGRSAPRWHIEPDALAVLEAVFELEQFPDIETRKQLGIDLRVSSRQIQVWFQNRRQRERKHRSMSDMRSVSSNSLASTEGLAVQTGAAADRPSGSLPLAKFPPAADHPHHCSLSAQPKLTLSSACLSSGSGESSAEFDLPDDLPLGDLPPLCPSLGDDCVGQPPPRFPLPAQQSLASQRRCPDSWRTFRDDGRMPDEIRRHYAAPCGSQADSPDREPALKRNGSSSSSVGADGHATASDDEMRRDRADEDSLVGLAAEGSRRPSCSEAAAPCCVGNAALDYARTAPASVGRPHVCRNSLARPGFDSHALERSLIKMTSPPGGHVLGTPSLARSAETDGAVRVAGTGWADRRVVHLQESPAVGHGCSLSCEGEAGSGWAEAAGGAEWADAAEAAGAWAALSRPMSLDDLDRELAAGEMVLSPPGARTPPWTASAAGEQPVLDSRAAGGPAAPDVAARLAHACQASLLGRTLRLYGGLVQAITEPAPPYRIISVSPGWERMCGYSRDEVAGKSLRLLQVCVLHRVYV
eukprot:scaffold1400_cov113-Isochrysis_galbana.AAC.5